MSVLLLTCDSYHPNVLSTNLSVVLLTLVLTDGALETQSDVMGPNSSTGEQKSAEKQVAKTLHERLQLLQGT